MKGIEYTAATTVEEAIGVLAEKGSRARVLAGGTDILVQLREGRKEADWVVDIKKIPEVNELSFNVESGLTIGAAVPCYRIYEHPDVARSYPGVHDTASLIGGIQIQSRASLGGNLCNASPAADSIPALIAYQAVAVVAGPQGRRRVPVEQVCIAPGQTALSRGEFLVSLVLPPPKPRAGGAYLRFIPRNEMDIAVAGTGVWLTLDSARARCTAARIALAAVAPTPLYVPDASAALVNGALSDDAINKAAELAQSAAKPISDMRGNAHYRRHLIGVLTRRAIRKAIDRAKEN